MPKINKGKSKLNATLRVKYPYLETTTSESDVLCKKCRGTFSIASGGNADIVRHLKTAKHIAAMSSAATSHSVTEYFQSTLDEKTAAMEGVWAYHTINSNQSFKSTDCASQIFKTCFDMKKFSCSRKKCRAIITNVFAPHVKEMLEQDLKECNFVTVYTDASNHGNIKMFPVLVRYFRPNEGVRVKMLDITAEEGETSDIISNLIESATNKYGLKDKVVGFCADNAKVNFGGETRGGKNNVFFKLKSWLPHLIGINCAAHVVHNALKHACDALPFDVEWVVVKIYSHFYIYTVRTEKLKSFCEEASIEYDKLLGYAKTRFLALGPAVKRILKVFEGLKLYFKSLHKEEKKLKEFFEDPASKFWLLFVQEQVRNMSNSSLVLDSNSAPYNILIELRLGRTVCKYSA